MLMLIPVMGARLAHVRIGLTCTGNERLSKSIDNGVNLQQRPR